MGGGLYNIGSYMAPLYFGFRVKDLGFRGLDRGLLRGFIWE